MNYEDFYDLIGETDFEPGVYKDVPDRVYFDTRAVNNSLLNDLYTKTPAKMIEELKDGEDKSTTDNMEIGNVAHLKLLRPEHEFSDRTRKIPSHNKNSKKFKVALMDAFPDADVGLKDNWDENRNKIEKAYPDAVLTSPENIEKGEEMITALLDRDDFARKIFSEGDGEVMFVWIDEKTGLKCKAKADWCNWAFGVMMDYKTTGKDLYKGNWHYGAYDFGYHRQIVHYDTGARKSGGFDNLRAGGILVQETDSPYLHKIFEVEGREWNVAEAEWRYALDSLAVCIERNVWPGYTPPGARKTFALKLPYSAYDQDNLYFEMEELKSKQNDLPEDLDEEAVLYDRVEVMSILNRSGLRGIDSEEKYFNKYNVEGSTRFVLKEDYELNQNGEIKEANYVEQTKE